MDVLFDDNGYVVSYALVGNLVGAETFEEPEDVQAFVRDFKAYRKNGNILILDAEKCSELEQEKVREQLRYRRLKECFPTVNRGFLWFETLSEGQTEELRQWYRAWLDVTETLVVPEKPDWLE